MRGRGFIIGFMSFPIGVFIMLSLTLYNDNLMMATLTFLPFYLFCGGIIVAAILNNDWLLHITIGLFFGIALISIAIFLIIQDSDDKIFDVLFSIFLILLGIIVLVASFKEAKRAKIKRQRKLKAKKSDGPTGV